VNTPVLAASQSSLPRLAEVAVERLQARQLPNFSANVRNSTTAIIATGRGTFAYLLVITDLAHAITAAETMFSEAIHSISITWPAQLVCVDPKIRDRFGQGGGEKPESWGMDSLTADTGCRLGLA